MAEVKRKEVRISEQFDSDIISVYLFGEEIFGQSAAKSFIADIYSKVWSLDSNYLLNVECRHLSTKDKRYRNIILGSYLIIYRITDTTIDVLRILHSHSSIKKNKNIKANTTLRNAKLACAKRSSAKLIYHRSAIAIRASQTIDL